MKGRIIFLTEEPSMGAALRQLLPKMHPHLKEYEHWLIINHNGKTDLEASYPRKLRAWREPGSRFIILRDNDGADCQKLKQRLVDKIPSGAPGYIIRLVCQELESWFLGDLEAVAAAYPSARTHHQFDKLAKTDPDTLPNASELIDQLTGTRAKIIRAEYIAQRMRPQTNRSHSFTVFIHGLHKMHVVSPN